MRVIPAAVAAVLAAGCSPVHAEGDGRGQLDAALEGATRARGCAVELWRAADRDPAATASLLGLAPAVVAPWGGAARGRAAVQEAILARAAEAQESAGAARTLALLGERSSAEQDVLRRDRIARSLAVSSLLCDAAARARSGLVAAGR